MNPVLNYTKKNLFKAKAYPCIWLVSFIMSFIYLSLKNQTTVHPLIMMVYFLVMFILVGVGNIYINKLRILVNFLSLILIYACILLSNNVDTAWIGIGIVFFLYLQLVTNFGIMYFERNYLRID